MEVFPLWVTTPFTVAKSSFLSSSSHHTVALIPFKLLEERVLHLESSAVDVPQDTLWWRTAACKAENSNISEKGTCRSVWSIRFSQPWRVSSNLCQCHESGIGGEEIKIIFYHKKNPSWTVASPVGWKRGELRGDASYWMKACRCSPTSLTEWAWTAREEWGVRLPVCCGSLRCPPRARAAGHLQLFLCGSSGL